MGKVYIRKVYGGVWKDEYCVRVAIDSERLRSLPDIDTYHYREKSNRWVRYIRYIIVIGNSRWIGKIHDTLY